MGGMQDKKRERRNGPKEQEPAFHPGRQDPVYNPEPSQHDSAADPERERRREEDLRDWDVRDEDF
ncbi:hypothetical protein [Streptomyces sp. NPDC001389]|uniref:hypothetical protein n=1 Tax=unclassified Streptomyces TaxID=2593676 RepID=UPI0036983CF3